MNQKEANLWAAISTFAFDGPDTELPFAVRLARTYGWEAAYAQRVITEYHKFLFSCCVSLFAVEPSDAVDQVWQLHLTYTKSYWHDLCRDTLGGELHHYPAQAGNVGSTKMHGSGDAGLSMSKMPYEDYFGTPSADIWPDYQHRRLDTHGQWINRRQYWVIPKPTARQWDWVWNGVFFAVSYWLWNLTGGWQSEGAVLWGGCCLSLFIYASGSLSARRYSARARRHIHYNALSAQYWTNR